MKNKKIFEVNFIEKINNVYSPVMKSIYILAKNKRNAILLAEKKINVYFINYAKRLGEKADYINRADEWIETANIPGKATQ